ncbi:DNA-directed DNA polymerase gamma mip1 [Apophysomyces ossiformis]|uniref:DNA-directed DNA polymerase n=1 Tax=Apophysomyces ossiformis TaxID=679940 RepID=A0A8H7EP35_9FUNG|nr:DNA-directed DNA polymerase gamma mip1 [Apophysomyces ossiformis]
MANEITAARRETDRETKTNPANVQLLTPALHNQLFEAYSTKEKSQDLLTREKYAQKHLEIQEIWGKKAEQQPPINLKLPSLCGRDIQEHFMRIGLEQCGGYLDRSEHFSDLDLPEMPSKWICRSGWTRYGPDGEIEAVKYPQEDTLVFDVEVLVKEGHYPTIAVAASPTAWYSWTSPYLIDRKEGSEHLISFGKSDEERLIIGHNVGYDRARIAEEYSRVPSKIRFLDTMSLHIAVAGLCSQQRPAWNQEVKRRKDKLEQDEPGNQNTLPALSIASEQMQRMDEDDAKFFDVSSLNSLKDVAKFHCNIVANKDVRAYFESGTLEDIEANFDTLMQYCANDVAMTHKIYKVVLPKFRENCPHPVSFAGMLQMGNSFLTVNEKWEQYLERSVGKHKELNDMLDVKLRDLADKARELVEIPEAWQSDPWLSQMDWTVNPRQRKLKGSPKWYKDAYDTKAGKLKITTRSRIAPLLLRLKWQDYPLHYVPEHGWCYKLSRENITEVLMKKCVTEDEDYVYLKVPHKSGEQANCGNPLAKNYMSYYEDKVLTSEYDAAKEALELNATSAYWISSRERILGQFVVWDTNPLVDMQLPDRQVSDGKAQAKSGIILPQMVTMGTVTRRAVEKTWLTASNAKKNRIGSELKSMVQAPEGYKIVGADVDSEELWISSVIGDAQFGFHGATALGWMTLQGTKAEGTDLHSKTANILGISRDKAKVFNYGRIYGAGVKFATSLLMQYNQELDLETAKIRAADLYRNTKGEKERSARNPFKRPFWHGGSESYMFNALESIALSKDPRTPVLGCAVTAALKPKYTGKQFLTSRINWVVQSSGVDYLHMLIVSMSHLIERYNIDARFMLSVHDEVRYLSSDKDKHRTALALQVANIWTRAMFSYKLGIQDLPQSVGFFSAVDIDHVLRKEPTMACTTPSHEEKIEEGISCTIHETIKLLENETGLDGENQCLLGDEVSTPGSKINDAIVKRLVKQMEEIQETQTACSLDFLQAQMYKDYRSELRHLLSGGKKTEKKVKKSDELEIEEIDESVDHGKIMDAETADHMGREIMEMDAVALEKYELENSAGQGGKYELLQRSLYDRNLRKLTARQTSSTYKRTPEKQVNNQSGKLSQKVSRSASLNFTDFYADTTCKYDNSSVHNY